MKIQLNGQEKNLPAAVTISALLQDMGLGERRVAVEVNREIVPRSRHNEFQLKDNDRVEVVFAIGGGSMSREQGPHAVGMRPAANAAGRRRYGALVLLDLTEAAGMSRGAGAPRSGDATGEGHRPPTTGNMVLQRTFGGDACGGNC